MKRNFILFLFILFFGWSLSSPCWAYVYIRSVKVDGQSIPIDGSHAATVQPGQSFWIEIMIRQEDTPFSGNGQFVFWLQDYGNIPSWDIDQGDFDECHIYPAYSLKWTRYFTEQIYTSMVSVEANEHYWNTNEEQILKLRITAKQPSELYDPGVIHFFIRATFCDNNWNEVDNDPWSQTGYLDCSRYLFMSQKWG